MKNTGLADSHSPFRAPFLSALSSASLAELGGRRRRYASSTESRSNELDQHPRWQSACVAIWASLSAATGTWTNLLGEIVLCLEDCRERLIGDRLWEERLSIAVSRSRRSAVSAQLRSLQIAIERVREAAGFAIREQASAGRANRSNLRGAHEELARRQLERVVRLLRPFLHGTRMDFEREDAEPGLVNPRRLICLPPKVAPTTATFQTQLAHGVLEELSAAKSAGPCPFCKRHWLSRDPRGRATCGRPQCDAARKANWRQEHPETPAAIAARHKMASAPPGRIVDERDNQMTRRGRGEGTVYLRSDGLWAARMSLTTIAGKRRRKVVYAPTRREASAKLTALLRLQQQGVEIGSERITVAAYLAHWLETVQPNVRGSTFKRYGELVRVHLVPRLGRIALAKLAPADLAAAYAAIVSAGLAPRTAGHAHRVLGAALREAEISGLVARNVARLARPPRVPRTEMHVFTADQTRTLLREAEGDRLHALYALAIATGARQGELLALRWSDLDAQTAILRIQRTLERAKEAELSLKSVGIEEATNLPAVQSQ